MLPRYPPAAAWREQARELMKLEEKKTAALHELEDKAQATLKQLYAVRSRPWTRLLPLLPHALVYNMLYPPRAPIRPSPH